MYVRKKSNSHGSILQTADGTGDSIETRTIGAKIESMSLSTNDHDRLPRNVWFCWCGKA